MRHPEIPKRIPCVNMYGLQKRAIAVFPGAMKRITIITESLLAMIKEQGALILPYPHFSDENAEEKSWAGALAWAVQIAELEEYAIVDLICTARVRMRDMEKHSDGYFTAECDIVDDELPSEAEVKSEEFKEFFEEMIFDAKLALDQRGFEMPNDSRVEELVKETTSEILGKIADHIGMDLNHCSHEPGVSKDLALLIGEGNVMNRLYIIREACDRLLHSEFDDEAQKRLHAECFPQIPDIIPRILTSGGAIGNSFLIPLPGTSIGYPAACSDSVREYMEKAPYACLCLMDPYTQGPTRIGVLSRIELRPIDGSKGQYHFHWEGLARVRMDEDRENTEAPHDIDSWVAWRFFPEIIPKKGFYDEDMVAAKLTLLNFMSKIVQDSFGGLDNFSVSGKDTEDPSQIAKEHPENIASYIDSRVVIFNAFSEFPEVSIYLHQIVSEPDVLKRIDLGCNGFVELIKSLVQRGNLISDKNLKDDDESDELMPKASRRRRNSRRRRSPATPERKALPNAERGGEGEERWRRVERLNFDDSWSPSGAGSDEKDIPKAEKRERLDSTRLSDEGQALERHLQSAIKGKKGQRRAIKTLVRAYEFYRGPLWRPKSAIGGFIFLGPSGVGKTQTARELAKFLLGDEKALTAIACGEYEHSHQVTRLLGSPPSYVGHEIEPGLSQGNIDKPALRQLEWWYKHHKRHLKSEADLARLKEEYERRKRGPHFSVVLFDEIEKAHPTINNMIMGMIEDGVVTLGDNSTADFTNSFIILTGNVASDKIAQIASGKKRQIGMHSIKEDKSDTSVYHAATDELKKYFKTEFLARVQDNIVVFSILEHGEIYEILENKLKLIEQKFSERFPVKPVYGKEVKEVLFKKGTEHPEFGAREIEKKVQHHIEEPLSGLVTTGQIAKHDRVVATIEEVNGENEVVFHREPSEEKEDPKKEE